MPPLRRLCASPRVVYKFAPRRSIVADQARSHIKFLKTGVTSLAPGVHMTSDFRAACVIGWPASHSRSPLIHNYWIKQHGILGEYRREAVPPEQFGDFIANLDSHGYVGANVTIPHKEAALALANADGRARAVGAANTLWIENEQLKATNTDVEGFVGNLDASVPGWDRGLDRVLVLGAGGAARAVVFGLIERGVKHIDLANRSFDRADAFRRRYGSAVWPLPWNDTRGPLSEVGLLVNATSLGMRNQPALEIDLSALPEHAIVTDLIYVPLETMLLATAKARGLRTVDGLGMLLHQAVRGFSLWFGVRPQVTAALRALVEADLAKS
jgi:shikimate dehydrogenase